MVEYFLYEFKKTIQRKSQYKVRPPQILLFSDLALLTYPLTNSSMESCLAVLYRATHDIKETQADMIKRKILIRGALTIGLIYFKDNSSPKNAFGPGFIRAYEIEQKQAIYPRIVIDCKVFDELRNLESLLGDDERNEKIKAWVNGCLKTDSAGVDYIDYLRLCLNPPPSKPTNRGLDLLRKQREIIHEALKELPITSDVAAKYRWLGNYHNSFIESQASIIFNSAEIKREDIMVEDDLLRNWSLGKRL